ncbi:MAG: sigma-70 family RNA polymerase sigma factor [Chloroflexota bacterium]
MQEEESLVQQAKNGDQEAFTRLYEEYFDKIYRYIALRISDRVEAEDMTQQVFLNALKAIGSYKLRGVSFSAWLYRIAHNQVVDYLRKKSRSTGSVPIDTVEVRDDAISPERSAERNVDIKRLLSATKQLTEAQREVISLRFTSGLSVGEVARTVGRSEGAVKALQHSAIVALRKILVVEENETVQ